MRQFFRRGRQGLQLAIGLAISGASIYLLLRLVDLRLVGAALAHAQWGLLLAAVGMYFVAMTLRAWRWTVLLTPVKRLTLRQVWPVSVLGYAANLILPARLGEVLRAAVLRTRGVPMSAGLATVATERVIDGLATVALVLVTMPLLPHSAPQWLITAGQVVGIVFATGLGVLWLILAGRPVVARILDRLSARFPFLSRPSAWGLRFVDGLSVLRSPSLLARTVGITALAWVGSIVEYWLAMRALGVHLTPAAAAFSISAIGLSSAIPAAPGYVGTQELVGVTVLGLWGVPAAAALAASLAFHVVEIVPIGIAGLIVGWREGVSLSPKAADLPPPAVAVGAPEGGREAAP
ncbi:MAG: lysylphosphatidylglycerol synthase transmembrane domain-containing protein [Nitrososphaerales archaeon]